MSKNIEKQGKRPGYIVGGIFAIILGALLVILYLPSLISAIAGIDPLWDLYSTFEGLLGTNFMGMFAVWGGVGILLLLGGVYFICLFARPSTASTMFRLSALFGVLSILVPNLLMAISLTIEDAAGTAIDLMQYSTYAVLALFVLSFIFYVIGFVARFKQKYHKNRASTVLVFAATFWMLLSAFPALNALNTLLDANVYFFVDAGTLVSANYLGFLSVFLIISAIWMFITVPHRVVVDYNPDTKGKHADGRPKVLGENMGEKTAPFNAPVAPAQAQPQAQQPQARFEHNYTAQPQAQAGQTSFATNPILNQPQRPVVQPNMPQSNFQTQPNMAGPRPVVQPQQPTQAPGQFQQPRPTTQPQPQQPRPATPLTQPNSNPYASFNNFTQNSPYNRPQQPRPNMPQSNFQGQPNTAGPRPVVQPGQNPYGAQPQAPRPMQPQQQAPRPPYNQPQQPPRPPVTPFTGNNTPKPNNGQNGTNGTS